MPQFETIGDIDPFLRVRMKEGEVCFTGLGRMVTMDTTLDLRAKMKGDVSKSIMRKMLTKTPFFFQEIRAVRGAGECLLAPALPGSLRVLEIGEVQYNVSDGCFLAGSSEARIAAKPQSLDKAFFSRTGGVFILESEGFGQIAVSGFGSLYEISMVPGHELIVHNSHVVAWQKTLDFSISVSLTEDSLASNIMNTALSGEGFVLRFSGYGKVIVCSRNRYAFADWVKTQAGEIAHDKK